MFPVRSTKSDAAIDASRRADEEPYVGVFDLFKIGIGPSSSHTSGPMTAAARFMHALSAASVERIRVTLFGSLAWTGKGHVTDTAVILGLTGLMPDKVDPERIADILATVRRERRLRGPSGQSVVFDPDADVVFDTTTPCTTHPNTLRFDALDATGAVVARDTWFSVGGGFVVRQASPIQRTSAVAIPFPFASADELLAIGRAHDLPISEIVRENEMAFRSKDEISRGIAAISAAMFACIERGLAADGPLPGALRVRRRAKSIYTQAREARRENMAKPAVELDKVSAFAIAVNEENASGGRVVTAPTNGAAGVVPAVLRYYRDFCSGFDANGVEIYFLTAAAIGALVKRRASISGAEVGCQGEVGTAAAMAAAGLCAVFGGSNAQIENAAEIAMEHHLGMTCDPIGGLVQIPCIERNAFGAVKAINAASLALYGDGQHFVSLDQVIETMRQTGSDMQSKYKETSLGGLAVNVTAC
jgi:L-serine dehydratase